ncbi:MAG TPA: TetR/AcrR family transcriptional regulator [Solirubrobacterales bacterium]|nr:TetR/AcrR family transcriptional regulator [Solirubrobacterales bacterium]
MDEASGGDREFAHGPLPRGRHRLDPEQVAENQRRRLVAAMARSVAERGYAATSVDRILEGSGVSRGTFYELFANRQECLLAAHEAAVAALAERLDVACAGGQPWRERAIAAIGAVVEFAAQEPDLARLLTLDALAADNEASKRGLAALDRFAAMLREGREHYKPAAALPDTTERALVGAVAMTINARLLSGESLAGLEPQLAYLVLVPYVGPAKARQLAGAPPQS